MCGVSGERTSERGLTHLLELLLILHFSDLDLTSDYIVSVCDNDLLKGHG